VLAQQTQEGRTFIYNPKNEKTCSHKNLHVNIHNVIIHNSQKVSLKLVLADD
jgi:hypothetical protein